MTAPVPPERPLPGPVGGDELGAARARLDTLDGLPVGEHAEVYAGVAALLAEALSDLDG
jgi:hypothetical protein